MAQLQLPLFAEGVATITRDLGVACQDGKVTYFYGTLPVFTHQQSDVRSFRLFTSQLYAEGKVRQSDLVRTFGVTPISVKRAVKLYREHGPGGFWKPRRARGAGVLTAEVIERAQELLDQGQSVPETARALGLQTGTLRKAGYAGRVHVSTKKKSPGRARS
jgi:transposase-like protein